MTTSCFNFLLLMKSLMQFEPNMIILLLKFWNNYIVITRNSDVFPPFFLNQQFAIKL